METLAFTPTTLLDDQRLFTAEEFEAMLRAGLFANEHVELIQGRLIMLMAQGPRHVGRINWLTTLFNRLLTEAYGIDQTHVAIQVQSTARTSRHNTPEPDVMLLDAERAFRGERLDPTTDIFLVVEVADTSLEKDLTEKSRVYASDGVRLLWVLDLPHRRLHVFRRPEPETAAYLERHVLERGDDARLETLPELAPLEVETLFRYMENDE